MYLHSIVWLNVKELLARSRRYIGSLTSEVWDPVDLSSEISSIGQMLRQCLIWSTGFAEHSETDD